MHYVDVVSGRATIHSDPFEVELLRAKEFLAEGLPGADGLQEQVNGSFVLGASGARLAWISREDRRDKV
jgi:hypothetical protein